MECNAPQSGDLLISRRSVDGYFALSVVPGEAQFTTEARHDAVSKAFAFAAHSSAAVWFTDTGVEFVRVQPPPGRHRSVLTAAPRHIRDGRT
jgi:hypothetical protein